MECGSSGARPPPPQFEAARLKKVDGMRITTLRILRVMQASFVLAACGSYSGCGEAKVPASALPVVEKEAAVTKSEPAAPAPTLEVTPDSAEPLSEPASVETGEATVASAPTSAPADVAQEKEAPKPKSDDGPPAGGRPLADRTKPKPGEANKITFDDLIIGMQADIPYRPWMMDGHRAAELDGEKVRISGMMHGGASGQAKIKEFVLLRNLECKFGPGGQADHLARIYLAEGEKCQYTDKTVIVEGRLHIEPYTGPDGNTWAIYRIDEVKIK